MRYVTGMEKKEYIQIFVLVEVLHIVYKIRKNIKILVQ